MKKKYQKVTTSKEYIIAEGELPVCLVAHLDTVGQNPPEDIYYDRKKNVVWSPQLLGADDRAGVYAIIQIIEAGYRPHIIFTTDEELGALGSDALVKQNPKCPLENLKAIIQLDRRGSDDCVFYDCDNPDFTKYIESFGFKEAYGSFSDISVLAPAWGVAAVNLSVGYYLEHSKEEHLKCNELEKTIERVKNILDKANKMPSFVYVAAAKPWNMWSNFNDHTCIFCGFPVKKGEYKKVKDTNCSYKVCNECYRTYYESYPSKSNKA